MGQRLPPQKLKFAEKFSPPIVYIYIYISLSIIPHMHETNIMVHNKGRACTGNAWFDQSKIRQTASILNDAILCRVACEICG